MANAPIMRRIYHPACGRSFYYALISKRFTKEIEGKLVKVKTYMCRRCGEEFTDLDIMEHEAGLPTVDITQMSDEERKEFINKLFKKNADNSKPS